MTEHRAFRGDPIIAGEGQLAAATEGVSRHLGDHESRDCRQCVEGDVDSFGDAGRLVGPTELGDVSAGGEDLRAAGHHDHLRRIRSEFGRDLADAGDDRSRERVHLAVGEGDEGDAPVEVVEFDDSVHRDSLADRCQPAAPGDQVGSARW